MELTTGTGHPLARRPALPAWLVEMGGWHEVPGAGWFREVEPHGSNGSPDFWWHHPCPTHPVGPSRWLGTIDCSTGQRHAILGGTLAGGDLTIGGGSGSLLCPPQFDGCGLHGWVRNGRWVPAPGSPTLEGIASA